jgi:hypothetical protein
MVWTKDKVKKVKGNKKKIIKSPQPTKLNNE